MPGKLVLLRHGQSQWNVANLFTGWHDVDLSEKGREEARQAGRELSATGIAFDYAYTSVGELENVQVFSFELGR